MTGTPFVWFGQVEVLEKEHQSLTVLWSEDTAHIGGKGETHLSQLLQYVGRSGLRTTLHSSHLGRGKGCKAVAKEQSEKGYNKCLRSSSLNKIN